MPKDMEFYRLQIPAGISLSSMDDKAAEVSHKAMAEEM